MARKHPVQHAPVADPALHELRAWIHGGTMAPAEVVQHYDGVAP